jgi:hypothetical protein
MTNWPDKDPDFTIIAVTNTGVHSLVVEAKTTDEVRTRMQQFESELVSKSYRVLYATFINGHNGGVTVHGGEDLSEEFARRLIRLIHNGNVRGRHILPAMLDKIAELDPLAWSIVMENRGWLVDFSAPPK